MTFARRRWLVSWGLLALACGQDQDAPPDSDPDDSGSPPIPTGVTAIDSEPQRSGDPEAGYRALVNEGYVSCGIPFSAYTTAFGAEAPEADRLPGREGRNAVLPYSRTAYTTDEGVELVTTNCLECHASRINGELVVGLGSTTADFTGDQAALLPAARALVSDPAALAELDRFIERVTAIAPYVKTETIGVNAADNIAPVLFSHRDRHTLEWHAEPLLDLSGIETVPLDVPPWWWMKKKNAMFYVGAGRGDHARIMMTASSLCVDSVERARAIDAYFPDIYAFLQTLEPPPYPFEIDRELADQGKAVFESQCSACHGTYGEDAHYPNLLVDAGVVGTDSLLANGASYFVGDYIEWFNESFWGEVSRLAPSEAYVAPPLDGVWASAPYFHNGSVPTVADVLSSDARPTYWTRNFEDSTAYDPVKLGWAYERLETGQDGLPEAEQPRIYDTTLNGYGNGGHPFGDALSDADRNAVIEYLKTL